MLITLGGFVLGMLYAAVFTAIIISYRNRMRKQSELPGWNFMVPAYLVKVFGSFLIGFIFQYIYGYGDTIGYYNMATFLRSAIADDPGAISKVLFTGDMEYLTNLDILYNGHRNFAFMPNSVAVARFFTLFGFLTGGSYLGTAVFFATFSFLGTWLLYRTFVKLYPNLYRPLAYAILFIPSACVWGSGVLKDSLTFGGLGMLMAASYRIFLERKKIGQSLLILVVSLYILINVKPYVVFSFAPALIAWVFLEFRSKIKNTALRTVALPLLLTIIGFLFVLLNSYIGENYEKYSVENVVSTATTMNQSIAEHGDIGNSSYGLGVDVNSTGVSYLQLLLPAYVVTFYRPFPWEAHNILSFLSVLESMCFIFLTLWTLRRLGVVKTFRMIFEHPTALFCFLFSAIFGIAVGIASENFGTLSRYKIPCMPFYLVCFVVINYLYDGRILFGGARRMSGPSPEPVSYTPKGPAPTATLPSGWAKASR